MLQERGVKPEQLPPADDVKKVQRKLESEEKKVIQSAKQNKKK
jgi:DNA-damage-inducible protein D